MSHGEERENSAAIGSLASKALRDPKSLTDAEVRKLAASAFTQRPDRKKPAAKKKAAKKKA
ncbi:hypothetical protein FRZ61_37120 [Hypericibacter adhaerens]|jgi:carnitine O-acetyltransferase|uniref:Uncharacterized protein n=1 Tax=Hypericibacter adhaerens TaxID=2602016 RepID=A0A5J6N4Q9_9PROT|nr:hypothetical protein FRZ61_37120 [Hypericibacter adhaerens]